MVMATKRSRLTLEQAADQEMRMHISLVKDYRFRGLLSSFEHTHTHTLSLREFSFDALQASMVEGTYRMDEASLLTRSNGEVDTRTENCFDLRVEEPS